METLLQWAERHVPPQVAVDATTAERIAFDFNSADCHCLTLEEHLGRHLPERK